MILHELALSSASVTGAPARGWILAIARSACLDRLRRDRRCPEPLPQPLDHQEERIDPVNGWEASPESYACARDLRWVVDRELRRMSEKNRRAYSLLQGEEGLSILETAARLGVSAAAVKQRAHRAGEQIKAALRVEGWEGEEA